MVRCGMALPTLEMFSASFDSKDRIIHELAAEMMKTRYSRPGSNGFRAFVANFKPLVQPQVQPQVQSQALPVVVPVKKK